MAETRATPGELSLSSELHRAIAADTIGCFADRAVLREPDVAALKRILGRSEVGGVEISQKRALGALARSDRSADTASLLARFLFDINRSPGERNAAAAYLALLPAEIAEKPLLDALPKSAGPLRREIIKSLGKIGTEKALAALRRISPDPDDLASRQIALAKLAIAFREERGDVGPAELEHDLGIRWETISAKRLKPKEIRGTIAALESTFGMRPNPDIGFGYDCGSTRHILLPHERLKPGKFVTAIGARNMIAALVVVRVERLSYFVVRWLLLTSPGKKSVRMVLARPDGEPAFEGDARLTGRAFDFTLRDTGIDRSTATVTGQITPDDVTWTMRVWRGSLRGKLRPRQITNAIRIGRFSREPIQGQK